MKTPEKIFIQPDAHDRWWEGDSPNDKFVEYIRKDIHDDIVKTAEDHAFLAGAEWMAEQGETVEGYIVDEISYTGVAVVLDNEGQFKPGDKVIVQIRKK